MIHSSPVGILRVGLAVSLIVLGGCASIDPDGEWRGTPEARLRACQAMFGSAAVSVREQISVATGAAVGASTGGAAAAATRSSSPALAGGEQCHGPQARAGADGASEVGAGQSAAVRRVRRFDSPEAIEGALGEAEQAYSDARYQAVVQLLDGLLADQPHHARGWLRQANALHRLDQHSEAALAYRRAANLASERLSQAGTRDPESVDVLSKASANLAILGIEQARRALDALGPADSNPVAAAHRKRIEAALRAVIGEGAGGAFPNPAVIPRPSSAAAPAHPRGSSPAGSVATARSPGGSHEAEPVLLVDASAARPLPGASASTPSGIEVIRGLSGR